MDNLYIYILKPKSNEYIKLTFNKSLYKYIEYDLSLVRGDYDLENSYVFVFPYKLSIREFFAFLGTEMKNSIETIHEEGLILNSQCLEFLLDKIKMLSNKLELNLLIHKGLLEYDLCKLCGNNWESMLFEMKLYGYISSGLKELVSRLLYFKECIDELVETNENFNYSEFRSALVIDWDDSYLELAFARAKKGLIFPFINETEELRLLLRILESIEAFIRLDHINLDVLHCTILGILELLSQEKIKQPKIIKVSSLKHDEYKMMQRTLKFSNRFINWMQNIDTTRKNKDLISEYFHDQYIYRKESDEIAGLIYDLGIQDFIKKAELI